MQFIHQPLTWGFLLALLPLLIHLINMMRHRRVHWAAMEFLLKAYKKHRKWIWLKQLLLLLMRMLAIAIVVAMLAQWVSQDRLLSMFGGNVVHHYVVLDDSYSMSQQSEGATAFDRARLVISQIVKQVEAEESAGVQKLTFIRASRISDGKIPDEEALTEIADVNSAIIDGNFPVTLEEQNQKLESTELQVSVRGALQMLAQLIDEESDEESIVYVLSDFRTNEWENPAELQEALQELESKNAKLELVNCGDKSRQNLGIVEMRPADDTRAAGVPLFVNISIKNYGDESVRNLQLTVESHFYDPAAEAINNPADLTSDAETLPLEQIEEIGPGETIVRRVQVFFAKPGSHVVAASLPDDPVTADNRRWCVVECLAGEPVLIVDGNVEQDNQYYLTSVFQPGKRANTGIIPETKGIEFIRGASADTLRAYSAIYLLDVPRLDAPVVSRLEEYVKEGGGLAFFVGENVNIKHYSDQLYVEGQGIFPAPLAGDGLLAEEVLENTPDIQVTRHPMFSALLGERNPLIRLVTVERYLRTPADWKPPVDSGVRVIATLRNDEPLVIEKQLGNGRILAFMSSLAPDWNTWANDPSFIVTLLKTQSYLASSRRRDDPRQAGSELRVELDGSLYTPNVTFITPSPKRDRRIAIDRTAEKPAGAASPFLVTAIGDEVRERTVDRLTDRSGLYEAWSRPKEGPIEVRRWAVNVAAAEGELAIVSAEDLIDKLDPVEVKVRFADEFRFETAQQAGFNRSLLLFCLLIPLLIAEQLLAYLTSYHPPRGTSR